MIPPQALEAPLRLCLYIAGEWPNSQRALTNLREMLTDREADVEIVDCLEDPRRGLRDGIFVTPTLVRLHPLPRLSILGDLTDRASVLDALMGLEERVQPGDRADGGDRVA